MFLRKFPIINIIMAAIVTLSLCIALGVGFSFIVTSSYSTTWMSTVSAYPFIASFGVISIMMIFIISNHRANTINTKDGIRQMAPRHCLSRDDFADLVNDICEEYSVTDRAYHACFMLCEIEATIPPSMSELQFDFDMVTDDYGTLLRRSLRNTDYVGQISPKVFGIFLLDTTRMQAEAAAQRILEILEKSDVSENVSSAISSFKIIGVMSDRPMLYAEFIDSVTHNRAAYTSRRISLSLTYSRKTEEIIDGIRIESISQGN